MKSISREIMSLLEADHESKREDFTQASRDFDEIFLDGDYIYTKDKHHRVVYRIYDDTTHSIIVSNAHDRNEDYPQAQSKDGYNWKIFEKVSVQDIGKRYEPTQEVQGKPIKIAYIIAELADKQDKN